MTRRTGSVIPKGIPFAQIPHALTLDLNVTNAGFRVYGLLMKLADTESRAWPGHRYLEDRLPMTRKTIAAAISNLETTGWLVVDRTSQHHTYVVVAELARLDLDWSNSYPGGEIPPVESVPLTGVESTRGPGEKLPHIENQDREPTTETHIAPRNIAFEFLVDPSGFGLPDRTSTQRMRAGRLARELNASIDLWLEAIGEKKKNPSAVARELHDRAQMWPNHFDVVMTADAYVKHFELLGAPPLKRTKSETTRRAALAAVADPDRRST